MAPSELVSDRTLGVRNPFVLGFLGKLFQCTETPRLAWRASDSAARCGVGSASSASAWGPLTFSVSPETGILQVYKIGDRLQDTASLHECARQGFNAPIRRQDFKCADSVHVCVCAHVFPHIFTHSQHHAVTRSSSCHSLTPHRTHTLFVIHSPHLLCGVLTFEVPPVPSSASSFSSNTFRSLISLITHSSITHLSLVAHPSHSSLTDPLTHLPHHALTHSSIAHLSTHSSLKHHRH